MQDYDVALKLLLQSSARLTMRELTGTAIAKWLDVELPKVRNPRVLAGKSKNASARYRVGRRSGWEPVQRVSSRI